LDSRVSLGVRISRGSCDKQPLYTTAYVAKAIELALIVLLAIDFVRFDGNPLAVIRRDLRAGVARLWGVWPMQPRG
jgi:hypothetical protein